MKHVLSCEQYTKEDLEEIFELAEKIEQNPKDYQNALEGKIVSVMFYEPSTRTRLSFETAVQKLGAKIISTENAREFSSASKGETLEDTVRVLQGYSDAIVMRHYEKTSAEVAASVAKVPIINAGSGSGEHPTQSLLDLYTIKKERGSIDNIKVAVLGDLLYGRTIHSLVKLLSLYENVTIYGLSKECFALPQEYIDIMEKRNTKYVVCNSMADIPRDVDVIYHTRIQVERFKENEDTSGLEEFIINKKVFDTFSENTILLHPLPRNEEIATDVDDDPRALFFKQAHNGVYVRMALLLQAFDKQ